MAYRNMTLDNLIADIQSAGDGKRFCFFLGSGASKSSGIKTGQELVQEWDEVIRKWDKKDYEEWCQKNGITPENRASFYSAYYDKRYGLEPDDGYAFIERITDAGRPNAGYMMLAQILAQNKHNVVITTNFDHLTENAVDRYTDKLPLVIGHENLAEFVTAPATHPMIVKIHRDMLMKPRSETKKLQKLAPKWEKALDKLFQKYHPVFIGYSGGDKNVMDFLMSNADKFIMQEGAKKARWKMPYWTFYGQDISSADVRSFMDKVHSFCIFDCDFDAFMVRLADAFKLGFPDVGKMLDAEKTSCDAARAKAEEISRRAKAEKLVGKADSLVPKKKDQCKEKERLYREAIRIDPSYARAHNGLGTVLADTGRNTEAEAAYREAIRLDPNYAPAHNGLGIVVYDLGRKTEAEAAYREAIRIDPDYAHAHICLGLLLENTGRKTEAETEYREAIRIDPDNAYAHNSLGYVLDDLGRKTEAEAAHKEAIRLTSIMPPPTRIWPFSWIH